VRRGEVPWAEAAAWCEEPIAGVEEAVGPVHGPETLTWMSEDRQTGLVTHDLLEFCRLLRRRNGYVLEQLPSPLAVETTPVHEELAALAPRLITGTAPTTTRASPAPSGGCTRGRGSSSPSSTPSGCC
jgi:hypothetical protein